MIEPGTLFAIGLGTQELIIIAVVVLMLFGAQKIPELMRGIGKGMGELQKGIDESKRVLETSAREVTTAVNTDDRERTPRT